MFILKIIIFILLLIICPLIIGTVCYSKLNINITGFFKLCFSYITGIFTMLAVFEIVCVSVVYTKNTFSLVVLVYNILLVFMFCLAIFSLIKNKIKITYDNALESLKGYSVYTYIYFFVFVVLLLIQIYGAVFYSATTNMADDAEYIVYGMDALINDSMYSIDTYTGKFRTEFGLHRMLQSVSFFYAYVSRMTGISLTMVAHTIMNVVFLIMSYGVYYMIAVLLFGKKSETVSKVKDLKKDYENVWIFLIFICVLYIFGYYSHYSLTFRLLSSLWQGKAVLAVIVTPFLCVVMYKFLCEEYMHRKGVYILMISIASLALSLMAFSHILLGVGILTVVFVIINKKWKNLLYILWAGIVPMLAGVVYLLDKYMML